MDRYELDALVSSRGHTHVYRGHDKETGRAVAVKLLDREAAADPPRLAAFEQRAGTLAAVSSPHVVEVFDSGRSRNGEAYMVMELLDGVALENELGAGRRLPVARARVIVRQVLDALTAARRAGIAHGRPRAGAVFLSSQPHADFVKLLDLGSPERDGEPAGSSDEVRDASSLLQELCTGSAAPAAAAAPSAMLVGRTIGGRFRLDRLLSWTGMRAVFQGRDYQLDRAVAVKLALGVDAMGTNVIGETVARMRTLALPGVVGHLESGNEGGMGFVAFEWLAGESLAERSAREATSMPDAVAVVEHAARALASMHAQGLAHQMLRPDRIFLIERDVRRVVLLDPGALAFVSDGGVRGAQIDDPRCTSPEEISAGQRPDQRTNVFALGCILYECLTGRLPHEGDTLLTVLARICDGNVRPPAEHEASLPPALAELTMQMLATSPAARPTAAEVATRLAALATAAPPSTPRPLSPDRRLAGERRVITVAFVPGVTQAALAAGLSLERVRAIAASFGARAVLLPDRGALVSGVSPLEPRDEAGRAVRCALAIREAAGIGTAVITRSTVLVSGWPLEEGLEAATALGAHAKDGVLVDGTTALLLDRRFVVRQLGDAFEVEAFHPDSAGALAAHEGQFVGRDRELQLLLALCKETQQARHPAAVTVTGEAGMGKSRLVDELLGALRAARTPTTVLVGRGDPVGAGSPFGIVTRALRGTLGVHDADPPEIRANALRERLAPLEVDAREHATRFLQLLLGVEDDHVTVAAARRDAALMAAYLRRAFCDWLRTESAAGGLLLFVVEDMHFGDASSIALIRAALKGLDGLPLLVVALARPHAGDALEEAWKAGSPLEIALHPLQDRDARALVRSLVPDAPEGTVGRIVDQAAGNPFFLGELVRAVDAQRLPETVIGAVQARLEARDHGERSLLRAASVFGDVFWPGGVLMLLGEEHAASLDDRIAALCDAHLCERRPEDDLGDEPAYAFRSVLVRKTAYAMLAEDDRCHAHRMAGAWLEWRGASDPLALAFHWMEAKRPDRAVPWYLRAARQCLDGNDFRAARRWVDRALAAGAEGELRAELLLVAAAAHEWAGDSARRADAAEAALTLLGAGTPSWFTALDHALTARARLGRNDEVEKLWQMVRSLPPSRPATEAEVAALARASGQLALAGFTIGSLELLRDAEARGAQLGSLAPDTRGWLAWAGSWQASISGDLVGSYDADQRAEAFFREAGDIRSGCYALSNIGYDQMRLGLYDEADASLRRAMRAAELLELPLTVGVAAHNLGLTVALRGNPSEGLEIERRALELLAAPMSARIFVAAREYHARILLLAGDAQAAEAEARAALATAEPWPPMCAICEATLAQALLAQERKAEALEAARRAAPDDRAMVSPDGEAPYIELALAEALVAAGEKSQALTVVESSCEAIERTAAGIEDAGLRRSFLERVSEHQRLLALREKLAG
jgi:eukaryotic-like serine/threonine-protein kinase